MDSYSDSLKNLAHFINQNMRKIDELTIEEQAQFYEDICKQALLKASLIDVPFEYEEYHQQMMSILFRVFGTIQEIDVKH